MNKKLKLFFTVLLILCFLLSTLSLMADIKKNKKGTYEVSGTFDGKGKSFGGVGDGSQKESQPAVFKLLKGAKLKNVVIKPPAGDGIHCAGNNVIENVVFTDVGEDAISMGGSSKNGGTVTVRNCKFSKAADKVFQVNASSTWNIINCTVNGAGKVLRQNGGKTFKLTVNINGLNATGVKEAVVRSDSPSCKVNWKNITCNLAMKYWFMGKLKASGSGGKSTKNDPRKDYSSK